MAPRATTVSRKPGLAENKPVSSRADRVGSFELGDIAIPGGREEDWRFTPLRRIKQLFETENITGTGLQVEVKAPDLASIETADRGDARLGTIGKPGDRTAVVAWNTFEKALIVTIPQGVEIDEPIFINISGDDMTPCAQHIVIKAEKHSRAVVVIEHSGTATLTQSVEIEVGEAANLGIAAIHEWDDTSVHASNHRIRVNRDSKLRHVVVTLGGDLVRVCPELDFNGPGADIELVGAYFVDAGQHLEHRVFVNHNAPHCKSRVTYKGALQGDKAHAVWIGDCLIGVEGDATDTYELNRNLILSRGAKADSVPNLEIENGEIEGAGHASATGRFDDEQLFYLCSRGISENDARRLVVKGFFAELIDQIGIPSVQEHLMEAIEIELDQKSGRS